MILSDEDTFNVVCGNAQLINPVYLSYYDLKMLLLPSDFLDKSWTLRRSLLLMYPFRNADICLDLWRVVVCSTATMAMDLVVDSRIPFLVLKVCMGFLVAIWSA